MDSGSCVLGVWKFRPRILLGQDHTNGMVTGQLLKQSYTATAPRKTLLVVHLHTYELNVLPV